jgi:hypothetical protein
MAIERLNAGTLTTASQIPFYDPSNGQDRRGSVSELSELLQAQSVDSLQTQYSAPNATGFSVTIAPTVTGGSVWLLLTPTAGFAAGTIVLPASATDGQEVRVSCTQAVTTLTVNGNGHTVNGAPTTLAANAFFTLRYDGVFAAWYRTA